MNYYTNKLFVLVVTSLSISLYAAQPPSLSSSAPAPRAVMAPPAPRPPAASFTQQPAPAHVPVPRAVPVPKLDIDALRNRLARIDDEFTSTNALVGLNPVLAPYYTPRLLELKAEAKLLCRQLGYSSSRLMDVK